MFSRYNYFVAVSNTEINMADQRVYVTTTMTADEVLAILKKTGREITYIGVKE